MSSWLYTTLILTGYGFVKEFRPGVPFLTPYLLELPSNFTEEILNGQIYPVWTYSYLAMSVPVLLITDFVKYKPVIILEAVSLGVVWSFLLWGTTLGHMQIMQTVFGLATATEVAYYSYIYAAVEQGCYQKVTSYVRGSVLAGRFFGYGLGQILILVQVKNSLKLTNYISFGAIWLAVFISVFIPRIRFKSAADNRISDSADCWSYLRSRKMYLKKYYTDLFVLKWSVWWAASTCLYVQMGNYIQILWVEIIKDGNSGRQQSRNFLEFSTSQSQNHTESYANLNDLSKDNESPNYNGLTEALNTLLSTSAALLVQFLYLNWPLVGEVLLGVISALQTFCLIFCSFTKSISACYALYVIYCSSYQALITIVTFNVADRLEKTAHGLIFGVNTFVALLMQTVLTVTVCDQNGLLLAIRAQFLVYGIIHSILAAVFLTFGIVVLYRNRPLSAKKCRALLPCSSLPNGDKKDSSETNGAASKLIEK